MTTDIKSFILQEKRFETFLEISRSGGGITIADLGRMNISTDAHITGIVGDMEDLDLITRTQKGRRKIIELTDKGRELGKEVERLNRVIKEVKEQ